MKTKLQYIEENYNMDGIETEEQMKDLVVEHWNDMAENCRNEKGDSPLVQLYHIDMIFDCFACDYYKYNCYKCIFKKYGKYGGSPQCMSQKSPYKQWVDEGSKEKCIEIAELFI